MPTTTNEIRAAVEQCFAQVARSPEREEKFPVGPASTKKLGYDSPEIRLRVDTKGVKVEGKMD